MLIKMGVCVLLGVFVLVAPGALYAIFGITLDATGMMAARLYAGPLFGNVMLTWMARNSSASVARKAIMADLCVYDAIGFLIFLAYQLMGKFNPLGWFGALLYLFFAVGFGYYWVKSPKP